MIVLIVPMALMKIKLGLRITNQKEPNAICNGNMNKFVLGQLNTYSLRNKLDCLVEQTTGNIAIVMVSKTK